MKILLAYFKGFFAPLPPKQIIETERCSIRNFCKTDVDALYEFTSMPVTSRFDFYEPYSYHEAQHKINSYLEQKSDYSKGHYSYAIELKSTSKLIGTIGCEIITDNYQNKQAQIGYTIHPQYHQKGLGYESCYAFIDHLFKQKVYRVSASCFTENIASWKLLEKLGLRKEAHHLKAIYTKNRFWDHYSYAILKEEWEDRRSSLSDDKI